jgi:hypothetical protein
MVVAAAVDDPKHPVLVEPLEPDHRRMKAEALAGLDRVVLCDSKLRPCAVVGRIAVRHDRVQAVVAAGQLDHDEDPLGVLLDAGPGECLRREGGRRPAENQRQAGADADAVQALGQEFAAGAETA